MSYIQNSDIFSTISSNYKKKPNSVLVKNISYFIIIKLY